MTLSNESLTLAHVKEAMEGNGIAFRRRARLQPAGGPGDKIFPPTYIGGKYAEEKRRIGGELLPCVLVDSVASQANRMELALQTAFYKGRDKPATLPFLVVDFAAAGLPEVGEITSLQAPHRIADAILRDSMLNGDSFEKSEPGLAFIASTPRKALGLLRYCPTALVFGMWHSTGILGGLGAKVQRALVSEIVAVNAEKGVKVSSRIDPLQIETGPVLYEKPDRTWTMNESEARKEKGNPVKKGKDGKPSEANHGNIPPDMDNSGGVTCDYALQTTVLSLAALRRIAFEDNAGPSKETAGRVALASLGLCAATLLNQSEGFDLRSRCTLAPESPAAWELVAADGTVRSFVLDAEGSISLLEKAVGALEAAKLPWERRPVVLVPNKELAELVRQNRELMKQKKGED